MLKMVEFSYKNEGCRMVVLRCVGPSNFFLESFYFFSTDILTFMSNDSRVEIWETNYTALSWKRNKNFW